MLPNGTELEVIGQQGDWLEIYAPEPGWVAENQTGESVPGRQTPPN
jgi:hypothetical protein